VPSPQDLQTLHGPPSSSADRHDAAKARGPRRQSCKTRSSIGISPSGQRTAGATFSARKLPRHHATQNAWAAWTYLSRYLSPSGAGVYVGQHRARPAAPFMACGLSCRDSHRQAPRAVQDADHHRQQKHRDQGPKVTQAANLGLGGRAVGVWDALDQIKLRQCWPGRTECRLHTSLPQGSAGRRQNQTLSGIIPRITSAPPCVLYLVQQAVKEGAAIWQHNPEIAAGRDAGSLSPLVGKARPARERRFYLFICQSCG